MEDERETQYDTPIPLRHKGSDERPNPWTRLEAADRVQSRLQTLARLVAEHQVAPDRNALVAVLETLGIAARDAVWGELGAVRAAGTGASAALWERTVHELLWPPRSRPAGD